MDDEDMLIGSSDALPFPPPLPPPVSDELEGALVAAIDKVLGVLGDAAEALNFEGAEKVYGQELERLGKLDAEEWKESFKEFFKSVELQIVGQGPEKRLREKKIQEAEIKRLLEVELKTAEERHEEVERLRVTLRKATQDVLEKIWTAL